MRWFLQVAALAWSQRLAASAFEPFPDLRILPLGDSITKGSQSSHNNGYRGYLRELLEEHSDNDIDMVGSLRHGDMRDNDHEGHSGEYLREIGEYYKRSIKARPNVVLIHAGTNNMDKEIDLEEAPDLMEALIDGVHKEAPDATILVMHVIWANDERMQNNTDQFNRELERISRRKELEDMHIMTLLTNLTVADLADVKHPNDQGYEKMARAWFAGITIAQHDGWLSDPVEVDADEVPNVGLGTSEESEKDDEEEQEGEEQEGGEEESAEEEDEESSASRHSLPMGIARIATLLGKGASGVAYIRAQI